MHAVQALMSRSDLRRQKWSCVMCCRLSDMPILHGGVVGSKRMQPTSSLEQRVLGLRSRSAFGLQALESSAQAHLQLAMLICLRALRTGQAVAHVVKCDFAIHGSCFKMLILVLLSIMLACILTSGEIAVAAF